MKQTIVAMAITLVFALPGLARADTRCYQDLNNRTIFDNLPNPVQFTPTQTSCSATPPGACWHRVTAETFPGSLTYNLWLAVPSSWDVQTCEFFDYHNQPNDPGDPIIRWMHSGMGGCAPVPCNTQPPEGPVITPLSNDVAVTGLSDGSGNMKYFKLEVPAGQASLKFEITGGTGDADLYVRFGSLPDSGTYDCRPYVGGNAETCTFNNPQAGTWYVMLNAYSAYSGLSVKGTYRTPRAPFYRYYNSGNGDHFYTTNWNELGNGGGGWTPQGIAAYIYTTQVPGTVPLYRYYNPGNGDHLYTPNWNEFLYGRDGWRYEFVAGYVPTAATAETANFYGYYDRWTGDHFYTTNWGERGSGNYRYVYEGVRCLVYTTP